MKVFFYSVDDEENKVSFHSEGIYENNVLSFEDKTLENTRIHIFIYPKRLIFQREGSVEMKLELIEGQAIPSFYRNDLGLEFEFQALCHKLKISKDKIDIEYEMILDHNSLSYHKIWIIIR